MKLLRSAFALAVASITLILAPTAAHAKWLRADTHHFVIYSEGSASELQKFGTNLERFDALLRLRFGVQDFDNPNKLAVFFLNSQNSVEHLYGGKTANVAGFYSPQIDGSYAVANRDKATSKFDLDGNTVLLHEYAHHFMFRNFTFAYPSWYVEGFAEYLSTVTFTDTGVYALGKPAYHRAYALVESVKTPIEQLLFGDTSGMKPEQVDAFYGRSWLLVHMLNMQPAFKGQLSTYFAAIGKGKSHRDAAIEAFGDLKALDKALDAYRSKPTLTYLSSKTPVTADLSMKITELDDLAGQLLMYQLKRKQGRVDIKSRDSLKALAAANAGRADIWFELALSERELAAKGDKAEQDKADGLAEAAVDRALSADPNHVRANVLKANILFKRLEASDTAKPADWTKARDFLVTANAHAVDDPMVLSEWYLSFRYQHREPSKTARAALAKAFELAPEVTDLRVQYALDLADTGEFDAAIRLVEFLAEDPHNSEQGKKLLQHLIELRDQAKTKTAAPGAKN